MKDELTKPEYKDMKLVKVAYGDDDDQKSFQETQGLIQAYPNLKGIISPTTVGISAAARYLSTSPKKGKIKLTGLGTPNQMRKFVKDGTVEEFALWSPGGRRLPRRLRGRLARLGQDHRQRGRDVQGRQARRAHHRAERGDHPRPADPLQQGEHRRLRLLVVEMDASQIPLRPGARSPARASRAGRGLRHRPRGLLGAVRRAARADRGLPARASRSASASSAPRSSRPGSWTPPSERARPATASPRAQVDLRASATRSRTPPPARCSRPPGGAGARRPARPSARGHARLPERRHRRVARQLRGLLRAGDRRRLHARAASPTTPSPGTIDDDARAWDRSRAWVRAAGVARELRRSRIGFLGHTYPGDARPVLRLHRRPRAARRARGGARDRRPGGARRDGHRGRGRRQGSPRSAAMFDFADPSADPIAGPIEPDQLDWSARVAVGLDRLVGRLRPRRRSPTTTAASTATRPSASAPA